MMYGKANCSFKGVDITVSDPQDISVYDEKAFNFAGEQKIAVEIKDMMSSNVGIGSVIVDGVHEDNGAMVGACPSLGSGAIIAVAEGKATISI